MLAPFSPGALSKDAAKRLLERGHHRMQQSQIETVATALGASGPNLLRPHFTNSPLSSASLLAAYVKHRLIRNLEHMNSSIIRRIEDMAEEKHRLWSHSTSQSARQQQCQQALNYLRLREASLNLRLGINESSSLRQELLDVTNEMRKLELVLENMEFDVKGSLHPGSLLKGDRIFLTPTEIAKLPSPSAAVRGVLIRINGPRKGNRCMTWQKSYGRVSINSIRHVTSEEVKMQIPSKIGVFGLTVRLVYGLHNRLIDTRTPLNLLDRKENYRLANFN